MHVPGTRITDPYSYQITENTYPFQRHVPVSAHYIDTPLPQYTNQPQQYEIVALKISIFGIKMPKVWIWAISNEQRFFIGIVDTENIGLDNKSIFLAGLEVDIS